MTRTSDVPVAMQRQVPGIQKVDGTGEAPQVQHIDRIVDLTVCGNTKYEPSRQYRRRKKLLWFGFSFQEKTFLWTYSDM